MIEYIKSKLRVLLESDYKTTANPINRPEVKYATSGNLENLTDIVTSMQDKYGSEKYFQDAREGDGVYLAIISKNGRVTIKTPNRAIGDNEIGGVTTTRRADNIEIPIKAYSGSDALLQPGRSEIGGEVKQPYTNSGASDARIKVYVIFGDMMIDRVRQNLKNGEDSYVEKDRTFSGDTEKQVNRKKYIDRRELKRKAQQLKKGPTTMDRDAEAEYLAKQDMQQDRIAKAKERAARIAAKKRGLK